MEVVTMIAYEATQAKRMNSRISMLGYESKPSGTGEDS